MNTTIETLKDALGNEVYRVSRVFPNKASAHKGAVALEAVNTAERNEGCGRKLAAGQWWNFCGETDMGQTLPALCTECGGEFILLSVNPPPFAHMPPNCDFPTITCPPIMDTPEPKSAGEYMAQLQADSAEGDLDPRAVQAGIEGAGT